MIPYEIARTPRYTERRRTRTMPDKKKTNYSVSLLRIFGHKLTDETWETALVTAVVATGEFATPKTDICGTLTHWDSNAWWRKDSWRGNKMAEVTYWREVYQHQPKPRNAGTETDSDSNSAPDAGKNGVTHGEQDRKRGRGGRASRLFSELANWGPNSN